MATLTVDRRSGAIVGYNIQWCENRRRHTIYLSSRTYRHKTAERFKEMVETLVYYRKNGTHVPDKAVANWLAVAPAELQAKLGAKLKMAKCSCNVFPILLHSRLNVVPFLRNYYGM